MVLQCRRRVDVLVRRGPVLGSADQCFSVPPGLDHRDGVRRLVSGQSPLWSQVWIFTVGVRVGTVGPRSTWASTPARMGGVTAARVKVDGIGRVVRASDFAHGRSTRPVSAGNPTAHRRGPTPATRVRLGRRYPGERLISA
jgi:hypothetical protein